MWNLRWFIMYISVVYSYNTTLCFMINMTEFREIDSDFDLEKAIRNYKPEDFDPSNIKGMDPGFGEDKGPKYPNYKLRAMPPNRTSEENLKLIEAARALIETSGENERDQLLRKIAESESKRLGVKRTDLTDGSRNNRNQAKPSAKKRVKRAGVGKFSEAAKVDNLKMLRIYLTMFSNLWTDSYTGGTHPLHRDVPKTIVILFKHRIMQFFFPPVGVEKHAK